ncbi:FxsA family protein [Alteromonas sp. PRIM-21]|uniref:FxsA family protein n=1 Tax=Alteromonas sp. PRIM-21 TaxID=1454978 RepID=UPI0022B96579|nr:FxsA family protein [Alteromonas sp. PRIM-21]MCZ8530389.1 FxsA family protein [Alteromonas sp. PRIM-21]
MRVLFILFALLPILEIALLINVGSVIGGWNTVGLVILSAFIGAYFVKREGVSTLQTAQEKMQRNEVPGKELVEGLMLVVAGILLVTPGFITDIFGFLLAMPGSRHFFAAQVSKHMKMRVVAPGMGPGMGPGASGFGQGQSPFGQSPFNERSRSHNNDGDVFEGEYSDRTTNDPDKRLK